jgi:hypothetical protein
MESGRNQRDNCTWPFLQNITPLRTQKTHSHLYITSRGWILSSIWECYHWSHAKTVSESFLNTITTQHQWLNAVPMLSLVTLPAESLRQHSVEGNKNCSQEVLLSTYGSFHVKWTKFSAFRSQNETFHMWGQDNEQFWWFFSFKILKR